MKNSVLYWCEVQEDGEWNRYPSVSRFLDKHLSLQFHIRAPTYFVNQHGGLKAVFTKENHGKEAQDKDQEGEDSATKYISCRIGGRNGFSHYQTITNKEGTEYRGLHTMNVRVYSQKHPALLLFEDWIGVYIV